MMYRFIKRYVLRDWWIPIWGNFPYTGYCTYNRYRRTVLDQGLTKDEAIAICKDLNQ